jgi:hypothetical protein
LLLLLALGTPTVAQAESDSRARPETDARDYEAEVALPSRTVAAVLYYRHVSSNDTLNFSEDVALLRAAYILRWKNLALVPIDITLPVATDLSVYAPVVGFAAPPPAPPTLISPKVNGVLRAAGIGDFLLFPTLGYLFPEGKYHLNHTYVAFTPWFEFPTGQYDPTHIVNLGTNRYTFQQEVAVGQRLLKVVNVELIGSVAEYTDNTNYQTPVGVKGIWRQDTTGGVTVHGSVDITPALLLAISYYWVYYGQVNFLPTGTPLNVRAVPSQTVNTLRFTAGIRIEKQVLLFIQYNQDVGTGGGAPITQFFGARLSYVW